MKHFALLLLLVAPAHAQSPFTLPGGVNLGQKMMNDAGKAKADASHGTLTAPTITGGASMDSVLMGGAVDSGHPGADGGTSANNLGLNVATADCPTSTQSTTSFLCLRGRTGSTPRQNYMVNINLDSYAGATHDVVGLYAGVRVHAGAPQSWSYNSVCHIEPGGGGCIGAEIDNNNWNCDAGDDGGAAQGCDMKTPIGLLLTGSSPYPSGPAIAISGASVGNAQWHRGIEMLGGHIIDQASIWTDNASANDYVMRGVHAGSGLEMSAGVFAGAAIHMSEGHNLLWTGSGGTAHNMFVDAAGYHFGSPTGAFVSFDNTGNVAIPGSATIANNLTVVQSTTLGGNVTMNNALNVAGRAALGALTVVLHTPTSSSEACTAGSTFDDANYHYVCVATNTLKRVALSAF